MAWPLVCLLLFMRWSGPKALLASVLMGYLLLPSATKLSLAGLPDLDKSSMIAIGVALGTLMQSGRRAKPAGGAVFYTLVPVFVLSPFLTAYFNQAPITGEKLYIPGLTPYDGLSQAAMNAFVLVPFWAGRRLLSNEAGHAAIVRAIALAMLLYSILVLIEVRLSPQLHRWVYGFFPHDFAQQVRAGGFRAVVFLSHGLVVAMLLAMGLIAAVTLGKSRARAFGVGFALWAIYLLVVLLLQKSLGAAVLGLLFGAVAWLCRPKWQLALAAVVGLSVATYPVLRGQNLVPLETITAKAAAFSQERAASLNTRLGNEDKLLARAALRPAFGWGGWGRNRVFDLEQGRDVSITDGAWVISIGMYGWVGYLATFGLLTLPVLRIWYRSRRVKAVPAATACLAMLLTFNLLDLIPNSSLTPICWLMAGALLGYRPDAGGPRRGTASRPAVAAGPSPALGVGETAMPNT